jgi:hypothetical protein
MKESVTSAMSHVGQGEVQAAEAREDPAGTGEVCSILIWVICNRLALPCFPVPVTWATALMPRHLKTRKGL